VAAAAIDAIPMTKHSLTRFFIVQSFDG